MTKYFILIFITLIISTNLLAEKMFLIPDRFNFQEVAGQPRITITETSQYFEVNLVYKATTEDLTKYLVGVNGTNFLDNDIFELELLPIKFYFLSEIFSDKSVVIEERQIFKNNEIRLYLKLNKLYSKSQINQLILFGFVYGVVDAKIVCSGDFSFPLCGSILTRVPVYNQFAQSENSLLNKDFSDYLFISRFLSIEQIGKPYLNLDTPQKVDLHMKKLLFLNGKCLANTTPEMKHICQLVQKHSTTSSFAEALEKISKKSFPKPLIEENFDFYILHGSQLQIKRINRGINFESLRMFLNNHFELSFSGDLSSFGLNVPVETQITPLFGKNSIYWNGNEIEVFHDKNLRGKSTVFISSFFGDMQFNLTYNLKFSFSYDLLNKSMKKLNIEMLDLEYENQSLANFVSPETAQQIISGYLQSDNIKQQLSDSVIETIDFLETEGIAIFSLND